MEIYGDESGHLRNLLDGDCSVFVLGIVAGPDPECTYCSARAVRRKTDLDEARWTDMERVTKRRFIDCLAEKMPDLKLGYIAVRQDDLRQLDNEYLLYQDSEETRDWDLHLVAYGYAELLTALGAGETPFRRFRFDQLIGQKQSDLIVEELNQEYDHLLIDYDSSHARKGIQTADCFAGAVAESLLGDADWLEKLPTESILTPSAFALTRLEKHLYDVSTGP